MRRPLSAATPRILALAAAATALAVATVLLAACASGHRVKEQRTVDIEVVNNLAPSFEVRVRLIPVGNTRRAVIIGFVPLGETRAFRYVAPHGRYYLSADGPSHGQTGALRADHPKNTNARSERFTIDQYVDRVTWSMNTNHLVIRP